ncbi:Uncharacterised protein [Niallia circulans]|uniref:hypothetical protein n=1 Tax=Niallia circulans TaxID=1397 RepID=UPI00077C1054|nr:hypothetical protein [Niallia circulans]MDR4318400.1 hypothetical protein [Niallia circulans]MED3839280.1 hypothetical protein [Niallia circulans]MED4242375.1 hypothetical protein [Niallia circulans]MED4250477.1 hypothetical protein [Niallia circulans]QKH59832.1 hypothetical protein FOC77_03735 [Niallia circulans]
MENKIKETAKQKVVELLNDYDVSYIDYDAKDNDYTVRLEAKQTKDDKRLKAITIELPREDKQPLLQITLDEEKGVPKVFYKGEEIELNREIFFHWESDKAIAGGLTYSIEHVEPGLIVNRIERRVKGHACD